jgi:hypothetical protein
VARDEAKAASIYAALCEAKDGWACTTLGVMHTQGRGVKPDMARARTLFKQACDAGNQTGCENLKAVQ